MGKERALYAVYKERGDSIRHAPKNEPWALEMQIEDPDDHVLRFGSEPETNNNKGVCTITLNTL